MSDASEVKRFRIFRVNEHACGSYQKAILLEDHDRIVADLRAEVEKAQSIAWDRKCKAREHELTIAAQSRKLDLARVLYRAAIKIIDRYSTEKFPLTPTIEDVMDRYDKELEAIEQGEGT